MIRRGGVVENDLFLSTSPACEIEQGIAGVAQLLGSGKGLINMGNFLLPSHNCAEFFLFFFFFFFSPGNGAVLVVTHPVSAAHAPTKKDHVCVCVCGGGGGGSGGINPYIIL